MKRILIASCAIAAMLTPAAALAEPFTANGADPSVQPVPIDYWAVRSAVSNVSISPGGQYMALMKIESRDGDPVIEVYETADLTKKPIRLNAKPMEFLSLDGWVSDEVFIGTAMQVVRKKMRGPEQDVREYSSFTYSIRDQKFSRSAGILSLVSTLPKEPGKILISESNGPNVANADDPFAAFRPRSYYKYDLETGAKSLVLKGNTRQPQAEFDIDGNPRVSQGTDIANDELVIYYRNPSDTSWREVFRVKDEELDKRQFGFVGDVPGAPEGIGYVIARNDEDTAALWKYDFNQGRFLEKVYGRPDADIINVIRSSKIRSGDDRIVGVTWPGAKFERHFFDQEEKRLYDSIIPNIPNAFQVNITSRSTDGNTMIVSNSGPKDSGTTYLIKDGKMMKIGSSNPLVKPDDLSDVEYRKITARDGLEIPVYITKPKGPGPHPLIVLPHGGPYITEVIIYDEWSQMLANNGYMVAQPQYRGSTGHGYNHYIKMWNQHGLAMSDDNDDVALQLIKEGKVDKDRVAMFGWSYGGYAALVAATRQDGLYQCTIPGAFVADALKQYNGRKSDAFPYFDKLSAQRGGKVGINPINELDKLAVPMLLIHPDWDRRVPFYHFNDTKRKLKKLGKDSMVKFLPLKGADHFLYTHTYDHNKTYYTAILDYLKNDCGPGGL